MQCIRTTYKTTRKTIKRKGGTVGNTATTFGNVEVIYVDSGRIEELLLKLLEKMAKVESKLYNIESQNLSGRIDSLEAQTREQDRVIKGLEPRNNSIELFIRDSLVDNNKTNKTLWISIGLAVFSVVLTIISNLIF